MKKIMQKHLAIFTFCASFGSYVLAPAEMESPVESARRDHNDAMREKIDALKENNAHRATLDKMTEEHWKNVGRGGSRDVSSFKEPNRLEKESSLRLERANKQLNETNVKLNDAISNAPKQSFLERLKSKFSSKPDAGVSAVSFEPEAPQTESTWQSIKKAVKSRFSRSSSAGDDYDYVPMNPSVQD